MVWDEGICLMGTPKAKAKKRGERKKTIKQKSEEGLDQIWDQGEKKKRTFWPPECENDVMF